jgi:hypothetical protein
MGGIMLLCWGLRFFVFKLYESPKFLIGRGRDAEAVEVIHKVAAYNGITSSLTLAQLEAVDREHEGERQIDTSARGAVARTLSIFETGRIRSLFATRKMAVSTSLLIIIWGTNVSSKINLFYI